MMLTALRQAPVRFRLAVPNAREKLKEIIYG